jgi:hypothetical protein
MAEAVLKTGNAVLIDTYAQKTALRLGVSPEAVRAEFAKTKPGQGAPVERGEMDAPPVAESPPPPERELWLLRFLLSDNPPLDWAVRNLNLDWLQHPLLRQVIAARLAAHEHLTWHGIAAFLDETEDASLRSLVTAAAAAAPPVGDLTRQVTLAVSELRRDWIDRQLDALKQEVARSGATNADIEKRRAELRALKHQPLPEADSALG